MSLVESLWTELNLATIKNESLEVIKDAAITVDKGKIQWLGPRAQLSKRVKPRRVYRLGGRFVLPGLIDPHTHIVYAGSRWQEFEQKIQGASYESIAKAGGGILSTVKSTRAAEEATLLSQAEQRLRDWTAQGVTCLEIKSGYGLDKKNELKLLRVISEVQKRFPGSIVRTFLGLHCCPQEYQDKVDDYVTRVCESYLGEIRQLGLADHVDGFCDSMAFSKNQIEKYLKTAKSLGFPIKLHAEQCSYQGGAALAAKYHALSVDHLEYLKPDDLSAIQSAGTVATLLPGAYYYLNAQNPPPVSALKEAGIPIALATDSNPGSSPTQSLLLMMNMAARLWGLSCEDALNAVTLNAARALGLESERGSLDIGKRADFSIWNIEAPQELVYRFGVNPIHQTVVEGKIVYERTL